MDSAAVANKSAVDNDSTKQGDSKQRNREKVNETRKIYPKRQPPPKPHNPAKIKVRKEDVYCHVGASLVFLVVYLTSVYYSSVKKAELTPSIFSDIEESLNKNIHLNSFVEPQLPVNQNIQVTSSINDNDTGCSLYIADSSMPNSGLGVFSMEPVEAGSVVVPQGATVHIHDVDMSPYIMLVKHHPTFSNVIGGTGGSAIVASKNIEEGEELFLNIEEYPTDFQKIYFAANPSYPTTAVFDKVDQLTKKVVDIIPTRTVTLKPKRKQYKQKFKKKTVIRPAMDATVWIQLIKEIHNEYDPVLANLLPDSHGEATSMIQVGGRAKYISNKRSPLWLSKGGLCIDGVKPSSNSVTREGKLGAVTTRPVKKGDIVITSPVYATSTDKGNENCFLVNEESLMLCPLSFSSQINEGIPASQCDTATSEKCPHNLANAIYQWSEFNEFNKNIESMSIRDLLEKPLTGLTIDVIALRDLDEDEEVFIDYSSEEEEVDSRLHLRKDMVPDAWK
mmetsp:Transcript_7832/g.11865  ORF Transcript_7832/g.11865 Transcript_7832/m.11865 type:complete len:505 (+) Transcript_7832:137-1651(+)